MKLYSQTVGLSHFCMPFLKGFEKVIFKQLFQFFQEELTDRITIQMDNGNTHITIFFRPIEGFRHPRSYKNIRKT